MTICKEFKKIGEYAAAGAFEEKNRSLFYRKALGLRRYYENCELYKYENTLLYPSGTKKETMRIFPHYMNGLTLNYDKKYEQYKKLYKQYEWDFFKYRSKVPEEHTVAGNMYCHSIPNYGRILKEGLNSYKKRIEKIKDADFREGLMHLYEGIMQYSKRCVEYLKKVNAEERLINALSKVPFEKADNIYEAIVSWNFIMYLDNCDNLGCLAKELYNYYTGEDVSGLLENLYDNLDANNGYTMVLDNEYNALTIQCLKASKGKRRPMIELFVDEKTPAEVWNTAFEIMCSYNGQPAFYNSDILLKVLGEKFNIPKNDLKLFCGGGCTESMIAGLSNVGSLDAGINLLLIFEKVMYEYLPLSNNFEDFYLYYIQAVKSVVNDVTEKISLSQKERAIYNPLPLRTMLVDDCIDNERDFNNGGARYKWSIINFAGMINVIDSMLTVKKYIFSKKSIPVKDFLQKLSSNDKEFIFKCRKSNYAFGVDDKSANEFTHKITTDIYSFLDDKKPWMGKGFLPCSIQFESQVYAGKNIGATPDGRMSGDPLCDSLGAIFEKDKNSPTALLNSVISINLKKALGVPVLNFNIDESWDNDILKALIISYMQAGGIQMQITCVSEEMLKQAYKEPEKYKNLVVRVGGFSEYFCRLTDEQKRMIMARTIHKGEENGR